MPLHSLPCLIDYGLFFYESGRLQYIGVSLRCLWGKSQDLLIEVIQVFVLIRYRLCPFVFTDLVPFT